ncbi:MAG: hypothetical protein VKO39_09160 [Cyanobacteriota bacterium]|nr:hypothetical protein [Cyanobacteriota bacterium]
MTRSQLGLVVSLPWLAAGVVLLIMTRIEGETQEARLGLFGSAAICFSIGCLARTTLALHELAQPSQGTAEPPRPASRSGEKGAPPPPG